MHAYYTTIDLTSTLSKNRLFLWYHNLHVLCVKRKKIHGIANDVTVLSNLNPVHIEQHRSSLENFIFMSHC